MRFHVIAVPHTRNEGIDVSGAAYTTKTDNFCKMMVGLGHEVYHYGAEVGPPCTLHTQLISRPEQDKYFSEFKFEWDYKAPYWRRYNQRAIEAINANRSGPKDFLCFINGCQWPVADGVSAIPVEIGIGYYGVFAKYKIFESHWHRAAVQATICKDGEMPIFDTVIPGFFNPNDFPASIARLAKYGTEPYMLFVGRIIKNKGIQIAIDTARATGRKLIIVGKGGKIDGNDFVTSDLWASDIKDVDVVYLGAVATPERNSLMAHADVLMAPTIYGECFGNIVIEAGFFGTPSITTNSGAFTETVQHGVTGYRCQSLRQFINAVDACSRLDRDNIRRLSVENYGLDKAAKMYQEYFTMISGDGWYDLSTESDIAWLTKTLS